MKLSLIVTTVFLAACGSADGATSDSSNPGPDATFVDSALAPDALTGVQGDSGSTGDDDSATPSGDDGSTDDSSALTDAATDVDGSTTHDSGCFDAGRDGGKIDSGTDAGRCDKDEDCDTDVRRHCRKNNWCCTPRSIHLEAPLDACGHHHVGDDEDCEEDSR